MKLIREWAFPVLCIWCVLIAPLLSLFGVIK